MDGYADIEPHDESFVVEPQAETCSQGNLACEIGVVDDTIIELLAQLKVLHIIVKTVFL